jgi:hypothetical protein
MGRNAPAHRGAIGILSRVLERVREALPCARRTLAALSGFDPDPDPVRITGSAI